jgi:predicted GIY-YIG superfamily endonuclease
MARYYSDMYKRRTCVYRFYDIDDALLYVGLSMNLEGRLAKHRRRAWWPQVVRQEVEWFAGREAAKAAERAAIRAENPIHNIVRPREGVA